jgi:2,3,4,5-tetrahydropyridine-2-carboxylate N-succinyltransferase
MSESTLTFGLGIGTTDSSGGWLEVFYPQPLLAPGEAVVAAAAGIENGRVLDPAQLQQLDAALAGAGETHLATLCRQIGEGGRPATLVLQSLDAAPDSVPSAYLKLHLLSHRLVKPHGTNLDGLFGILPNVAWTSEGAVAVGELAERQLAARLRGEVLEVSSVDKFPKMTNYVVPAGVRIAHTARVRLGAYLGEGTTIMHEGFVNFNAGTEGPGMIEGRVSAGVVVGAGSDLGGSSSTMGTLSGGGNIVIALGRECLLGANAGIGIPLGDRCTVEAGLYITAGTVVSLLDSGGHAVERVKARELAGRSDLLFRRNSTSGAVECLTNKSAVELNAALHSHN